MQYKKYGTKYILRLDPGDEIVKCITTLAETEKIHLATVSGIGAVNKATVGVFDTVKKEYIANKLKGIFEIVSLAGNISTMKNQEYVHMHIALGDEKGQVFGGHLNEAIISATAEIIIDGIDGSIDREFNETIGLNILKF